MEKCICGNMTIIIGNNNANLRFICECANCHMSSRYGHSKEEAVENWDYMIKMLRAGEANYGIEKAKPIRKPIGCGNIYNNQPFVVCDDGTCWYEYDSKWENTPPIPGTVADMVKK